MKGKFSMIFISLKTEGREKVDKFSLFPVREKVGALREFPSEGKSRDLSRFSLGRKNYYYYVIVNETFP